MSAYLISEIDWHDSAKATEYREKFGPALEKYGGRTLCAGPPEVLEGSWKPPRLVVLEFPSIESLRTWYNSPEHAPVRQLRMDGASSNVVAVEGPKR